MRLAAVVCVVFVLSLPVWADDLALRPGLVVTWNVHTNVDYTIACAITEASARGYRVSYTFSAPLSIQGTQFVSSDDMRTGTLISAGAKNGDITQPGEVSLIRISDAMFAALKAGQPAPFNFTGPKNPRTLQKVGEADLTVTVDEKNKQLHTIVGRSADGGTFWVLDDPALPIVLQGDYAWKWSTASIRTGAKF